MFEIKFMFASFSHKSCDTLEHVFVFFSRNGYSFDCLDHMQPGTTDIRSTRGDLFTRKGRFCRRKDADRGNQQR